ncbi:hypothetical protein ACQKMV_00235 [Lysinibacillus sp. NPDC094403]|uniref:hypothetical protein n=1 Tax=Lysinibacillus sp. NPDC094403 TaxID=3390581 RepID=UPI003CFE225F
MLVAQTQIASNLPDTIQQVTKDLAASEGFESLVKEGQAKGVIREGDSKALAGCFYSAIQGVAQTYVCFPDIPLPQSGWLVDILKKQEIILIVIRPDISNEECQVFWFSINYLKIKNNFAKLSKKFLLC